MMGLEGPPNFKMKKFPKDVFENFVGDITVSKRFVLPAESCCAPLIVQFVHHAGTTIFTARART